MPRQPEKIIRWELRASLLRDEPGLQERAGVVLIPGRRLEKALSKAE